MRYVLKDLSINTEARTVHRDDSSLKLPGLSFDVLIKLIEAAPNPVSIADFSSGVWRAEHVSDETIAQRITLLRKTLGDNPKDPTYIRTVRNLGYAIAGSGVQVEHEPVQESASFLNRGNLAAGVAGLAVVLLAAFLFPGVGNDNPRPADTVAKISPKSTSAMLIDRAQAQLRLHQARETDRAIDLLRDALAQDRNNFDARLTLSFALTTKATKFGGNDIEKAEAEALARSLISERPGNSKAWSALGYTLDSQGRSNESLPAYQYAYRLDPKNAPALSSAAYSRLILGELYQALTLELQVRQSGNSSRYSEIQIAQIMELIDHPSAAEWHAKALSLNPGQVVILSEIARSHLRQGNPHAALEILARAEGNDRSAPSIVQLRARSALMLGNMEQARELLEAAGHKVDFDIAALNALAGDVSQAEIILEPLKLAEIEESTWPGARVHLAEIAAALGREDDALRFLTQAVNLGWRDVKWLKQSPFLRALMSSSEGGQLESRIERKLDAQRLLIVDAEELTPFLMARNYNE